MIIALVAGEASGDQLGAALIQAIKATRPEARFAGIGGPLMEAAGMDCWWDSGQLSIMGLSEVIKHIPRLITLRRQLIEKTAAVKPDVFIGIDAPDFNLGVEKRLRTRNIPVIHYVSPTVWAWRSGRVKTIAKSTQRVLCLFPFEADFFHAHAVEANYTGHPLADQIPLEVKAMPARESLGIEPGGLCIALLPGSRLSEVEKLSAPMLEAAEILGKSHPDTKFLIPAANDLVSGHLKTEQQRFPALDCRIFTARAKEVMAAADLVICASGTTTLEVMLINRPMVVCYRLTPFTYRVLKWFRMVKTQYFALPNILASESLVPELIQHEVSGQNIAREASAWLNQPERCNELRTRFEKLHAKLRIGAAATAARVVLQHIEDSK